MDVPTKIGWVDFVGVGTTRKAGQRAVQGCGVVVSFSGVAAGPEPVTREGEPGGSCGSCPSRRPSLVSR